MALAARRRPGLFLLLLLPLCVAGAASAADGEPSGTLTCPSCDDWNNCTRDSCDASTGYCRHERFTLCDDGNPCTTQNEICCPDATSCAFLGCEVIDVAPAGTACDDGNPCTVESACDSSGRCVGTPLPAGSACDDGSLCTRGEVCVETAGGGVTCEGASRNCDDGDPCTRDSCASENGECTHEPLDCNDGNACTADSCDPQRGCVHSPVSEWCEADGNSCTQDYCSGGNCFAGARCPLINTDPCIYSWCGPFGCEADEVSNGTICRNDLCGIALCWFGVCHEDYSVNCNDGDPLTIDSCDPEVGCVHTSVCDDGNSCTLDSRDSVSGACSHQPLEGACEDGDACTIGDVCSGGACRPGGAPDCDDANPCTDDSCQPASGCVHAPNTLGCDDGDACTRGDVCREGVCTGGAVTCDDGSDCTLDSCDPAVGCTSTTDPGLPDRDYDATPDLCDSCPTIANPDQDPAACEQAVVDIVLGGRRGRSAVDRTLGWRTTHEVDVQGYHVIEVEDGGASRQLNEALIPCTECTTGAGASYTFRLRGLGRTHGAIYIDLVRLDGRTERFGPAAEP